MKYAVADIGSNTVVLIIYEFEGNMPKRCFHVSTPCHLIDYVDENKVMAKDGIDLAQATLKHYFDLANEQGASYFWADITEPCRIKNCDALVEALSDTGFEVYPLTGEQEASYDFTGAKLSYPEVKEGVAFDVGGGSSEFIAFENNEILCAVSIPLGCVRLSHMPVDTPVCAEEIKKMQKENHDLCRSEKTLIGIGGTMKFIGLMADEIYHSGMEISLTQMKEMYENLLQKDEYVLSVFRSVVTPARQSVFLEGYHMILEIMRIFSSEQVLISDTGIREGFLIIRVKNIQNQK